MPDATRCAAAPTTAEPCSRCDLLLGLDGVHVEAVERAAELVIVTVSTPWQLMGPPRVWGVVALSRDRAVRILRDVPHVQVAVRLRWRQRRWRCPDRDRPVGTIAEQVQALVAARGKAERIHRPHPCVPRWRHRCPAAPPWRGVAQAPVTHTNPSGACPHSRIVRHRILLATSQSPRIVHGHPLRRAQNRARTPMYGAPTSTYSPRCPLLTISNPWT